MIFLTLALLMIQLKTFKRMLLVLSIVPLGLIGVVGALLLSGRPLGFVAILGILSLIRVIARKGLCRCFGAINIVGGGVKTASSHRMWAAPEPEG